jgi:hypothetical protein
MMLLSQAGTSSTHRKLSRESPVVDGKSGNSIAPDTEGDPTLQFLCAVWAKFWVETEKRASSSCRKKKIENFQPSASSPPLRLPSTSADNQNGNCAWRGSRHTINQAGALRRNRS